MDLSILSLKVSFTIFIDTREKNIKEIYKKFKFPKVWQWLLTINWFIITSLLVTSVMKNSFKIKCMITVICRASLGVMLTKSAKYKFPKFFPVVFHKMSGFHSHLFIKILGNSEGDIYWIPNNEGNYISFPKQVIVDKFLNKEGNEVIAKRV